MDQAPFWPSLLARALLNQGYFHKEPLALVCTITFRKAKGLGAPQGFSSLQKELSCGAGSGGAPLILHCASSHKPCHISTSPVFTKQLIPDPNKPPNNNQESAVWSIWTLDNTQSSQVWLLLQVLGYLAFYLQTYTWIQINSFIFKSTSSLGEQPGNSPQQITRQLFKRRGSK